MATRAKTLARKALDRFLKSTRWGALKTGRGRGSSIARTLDRSRSETPTAANCDRERRTAATDVVSVGRTDR